MSSPCSARTRAGGVRGTAVYRLTQDAQGTYGAFTPHGRRGRARHHPLSRRHPRRAHERGRGDLEGLRHLAGQGEDDASLAPARAVAGRRRAARGGRRTSSSATRSTAGTSHPRGPVAAGDFGHAQDGARPSWTRLTDRVLSFDEAAGAWKTADAFAVRDKSVASDNYRVYLEPSARGSYANLLMVREAKGFGTTPLFPAGDRHLRAVPRRGRARGLHQLHPTARASAGAR